LEYNLLLEENEIQYYKIFGSKSTYVVLHIYNPPEDLQFAHYYNTLIMQGYSSFSSDTYSIQSFRMVNDGWVYLYCYHATGTENSTINFKFKLYYVEDQGQIFYPDVL